MNKSQCILVLNSVIILYSKCTKTHVHAYVISSRFWPESRLLHFRTERLISINRLYMALALLHPALALMLLALLTSLVPTKTNGDKLKVKSAISRTPFKMLSRNSVQMARMDIRIAFWSLISNQRINYKLVRLNKRPIKIGAHHLIILKCRGSEYSLLVSCNCARSTIQTDSLQRAAFSKVIILCDWKSSF
jgi:hypothetical protein